MSTAQFQAALQQHNSLVDQALAADSAGNKRAAGALMLNALGLQGTTGTFLSQAQSKWGGARARICTGQACDIAQMPDAVCPNAARARTSCQGGGSSASSGGGAAATPAQTGPTTAQNVGTVLTGVGSILGPLANAFATGYSAKLQVDAQKAQLRQQQSVSAFPSVPFIPPPPARSNTGLILAGVGGVIVLGVIIFAVAS